MDGFYGFMRAALPWIAIALALAIFSARAGQEKETIVSIGSQIEKKDI